MCSPRRRRPRRTGLRERPVAGLGHGADRAFRGVLQLLEEPCFRKMDVSHQGLDRLQPGDGNVGLLQQGEPFLGRSLHEEDATISYRASRLRVRFATVSESFVVHDLRLARGGEEGPPLLVGQHHEADRAVGRGERSRWRHTAGRSADRVAARTSIRPCDRPARAQRWSRTSAPPRAGPVRCAACGSALPWRHWPRRCR